jgi:hypothetical protein
VKFREPADRSRFLIKRLLPKKGRHIPVDLVEDNMMQDHVRRADQCMTGKIQSFFGFLVADDANAVRHNRVQS